MRTGTVRISENSQNWNWHIENSHSENTGNRHSENSEKLRTGTIKDTAITVTTDTMRTGTVRTVSSNGDGENRHNRSDTVGLPPFAKGLQVARR